MLIEDAEAMLRAGRGSAAQLLDLAVALAGERDRNVVASLAGSLEFVRSQLTYQSLLPYFDRWVRATFTPAAKAVGWTPRASESDEQRELRGTLLALLGTAGDAEALRVARRVIEDPAADASLVEAAFYVAAVRGDAALHARFAERFANAKSNDEYRRYLFSLASFRDRDLAQRTLAIVTGGKVRMNDYPGIFAALLSNPATREVTWHHLKSNWSDLQTKITSFGGRGAVQALGSFCTPAERDDVRAFFATHEAPGAERALAQALERIDTCIALRSQHASAVASWLSLHPR